MNRRFYRRCEINIERNRRDIKIDRVKEKKIYKQLMKERSIERHTGRKSVYLCMCEESDR